jgi:hypothetical protein
VLEPAPASGIGAGLRPATRYLLRGWWLVVAGAIAGAVFGYVTAATKPAVYHAEAVVVATNTTLPTDNFDNVSRAVFQTDTVLQPVIDALHLTGTPRTLVSRGELTIQPVSGAVAVRIVGRNSDPSVARDLANTGATSFIDEASKKGLGTLALFPTSLPGAREVQPTRRDALVSGIAGASLAIAALLLVFAVRQPIMNEAQAGEALSARAFTAHAKRGRPGKEGVEVVPAGALAAARRAADGDEKTALTVLVSGRGRLGRLARDVAMRIRPSDGRASEGPTHEASPSEAWAYPARADAGRGEPGHRKGDHDHGGPGETDADARNAATMVTFEDGTFSNELDCAQSVIVVVPAGTPGRSLRRLDDELRVAPAIERRVVVLVDRG